ncbi:MAG: hypothetical protein HND51_21955 [Chloroflexi bacterium]|nr:hypothetical protein [Chloroflexota bacterium]
MKLNNDEVGKLWTQRKQRAFNPRSPSRLVADSFGASLILLIPWMLSYYSRQRLISLSIAAICLIVFASATSILWIRDKNNSQTKVRPIVVILVFGWNSLLLIFFAFSCFASSFGFAQITDNPLPLITQVVWIVVLFATVVYSVLTSPSKIVSQLDRPTSAPISKSITHLTTIIGTFTGPVIVVLALVIDMPVRVVEPIFAVSFFLFGLLFLSVGIFNLLETLTLLYHGLEKASKL